MKQGAVYCKIFPSADDIGIKYFFPGSFVFSSVTMVE